MAPTITEVFPQRKLRSSSLSTPKKKTLQTENVAPKSEVKKTRPSRAQNKPKIADSTLRGVLQSPTKGSPIKKRTSSVAPLKSPIKSILQSPIKGSPTKRTPSVAPSKSPFKSKVADSSALRGVLQSPTKGSPIKKRTSSVTPLKAFLQSPKKGSPTKRNLTSVTPLKSPLKSLQLNSPSTKQNNVNKSLFEDSPKRMLKLDKADLTRFSEAKLALSSSLPDEIFGREKQIKKMREFLENNLVQQETPKKKKKNVRRSIYVSGPPGTGKTTCLKRILNELPVGKLKTVFVNCMSIGQSGGIFARLVDEIFPSKSYSNSLEAQRILEQEVTKSKVTILLVLDEIDQLDSKNQEVLYTLFEWPYLNNSKLVLVGIANALDLTDRILPRLTVNNAFRPEELSFPAYTTTEIVGILKSRLTPFIENSDKPLFKPGALMFLARKISSQSGDVRRALDVCRKAIEQEKLKAQKQTLLKPLEPGQSHPGIQPIDVPQMARIYTEIDTSRVTAAIRNGASDDLPLQQKLLLASILLMSNHRSNKEITLGKLHETYAKVCKKRGMASVDLGEADSMCGLLEAKGLLSMKRGGPWALAAKDKKLNLRIDEKEVEAALKDKTLLSNILTDIDCLAK